MGQKACIRVKNDGYIFLQLDGVVAEKGSLSPTQVPQWYPVPHRAPELESCEGDMFKTSSHACFSDAHATLRFTVH
eukprot:1143424-Pelagomonas_calceolata.AAC.4